MKTANHHVRRKRLSGLCSKVSEFQMTGCRMCDLSVKCSGFLAQRRLFAEVPFSDQHQTASMIFRQGSVHFLHFPNKAQGTYQDVHVKGLLTRHGFVMWDLEPRARPLCAINSLCKIFLLPSRPTNKKLDSAFCVRSHRALQSQL